MSMAPQGWERAQALALVYHPDPRLGEVCAPAGAPTGELADLAARMIATMYAAPGRGLAGPQVGAMRRIFVMDPWWKDGAPRAPMVLLDPKITWSGAATATRAEGCLSIPGPLVEVTRPAAIRMAWTGLDGARHEATFEGFAAGCAQHELDHLDGILTLDRVDAAARAAALTGYEAPA